MIEKKIGEQCDVVNDLLKKLNGSIGDKKAFGHALQDFDAAYGRFCELVAKGERDD